MSIVKSQATFLLFRCLRYLFCIEFLLTTVLCLLQNNSVNTSEQTKRLRLLRQYLNLNPSPS